MEKSITAIISFVMIVVAFGAGLLLSDREHRQQLTEITSAHQQLESVLQESNAQLASTLEQARLNIEQLEADNRGLQLAKEEYVDLLEELNDKLQRREDMLRVVTDGQVPDFELLEEGATGTIVYVKETPNDNEERERLLYKLGAAFAHLDTVSFWSDKTQAERYVRGELERNADEMLPPYVGMFGEIVRSNEGKPRLLLHGSTGGPLDLQFGKYGVEARAEAGEP
ncbi:hypothetical protein M6D81_24470 [Paenibacillus sp. J5C_2022]|uniref:hypothetical protein n=1 Tax=Paenibacillus sp. J5C2022 TaxID=2977129 RepID=UPI0021CFA48B|nr:hypothetical protein [Paenibacillus sp. J5C2022]MCU6711860.1 hypothetical protein [Paenibacillus sp. J5C2022]